MIISIKKSLILAFLASSLIAVSNANAICDINAKVTRVLLNPQGGTIILQGLLGDVYRFQGKTDRADIIALATAAQAGGTYLFVRGDATTCPATGSVRDIGTLTHMGTGY